MSLINSKEKEMIKSISDKMSGISNRDTVESSYYVRCQDNKEARIMEYGFQTPLELQNQLKQMWQRYDKLEMQEFAVVCSIATFKAKSFKSDHKISTFLYEF